MSDRYETERPMQTTIELSRKIQRDIKFARHILKGPMDFEDQDALDRVLNNLLCDAEKLELELLPEVDESEVQLVEVV